ncbi:MAG TPA: mechanosensitive ion channel domain-containing protein [Casimicrobiaceae bacterium]|nr:mechanosensitive ion channel domain-containing protein [Casimicrobiaceae bacterium]
MRGTPHPRWQCALRTLVAALALAAFAVAAQGQGPAALITAPSKQETAGAPPAAPPESREGLVARLRKEVDEVNADRARSAPLPGGILPAEVDDLMEARAALVASNELQLRTLADRDRVAAAREAAEAVARNWRGFDAPPPYSILMVDELRDAADASRARAEAIGRSSAHLKSETERLMEETRRADEAVRRTQEAMDTATDVRDRERATWRRDLAQLRLRALGSRAAATRLLQQVNEEEGALRRSELALLERKIEAASRDATFGDADLAKAKARLAALAASLKAEQQAVAARIPAREKERAGAEAEYTRLRGLGDGARDDARIAEARLRAAEAWVAALHGEQDLLDNLALLATEQGRLWEARRTAMTATDADERRAAGERLRTAASRLARWRGYLDNVAGVQRARLAEAEAGVVRTDALAGAIRFEQDKVAALRRLSSTVERAQDAIGTTLRTVDRWVQDFDRERGSRSFAARLQDNWSALKAWVRDVWNFELFAVEDTATIDGREVKTSRGVTVGKSIGAVLVFVVGYWLAAAAGRRIERGLVARGLDARRVRNARRWTLFAVAAMLALFTLNVARIPLTVFAFLGGALAIGVGFGTQTIIRNFISGLIMLAERRIRLGDIIEVDGVAGTVTAVDLRSSTILGFDGVETAIPNAVFLENKVTNWTETDRKVRRVVKVGVAYGSPLREVAEILEDCAKRHGVVLDDPAPLVVLEDFGADALAFALYFWVELRTGVNAAQVASDLRYMIAKRFAEAGIAIPSPQRDVHLVAGEALRVELAGAPRGAGGSL